jgi:hypothetical protein
MKRLYPYFACLALGASVISGCTDGGSKSSAAPSETVASAGGSSGTTAGDGEASTGSTVADGSANGNDATSDTLTPAVTALTEQPGSSDDDFVGAAKDVKLESCKLSDGKWKANGTVTNASGADAKYRIYVALNAPGTTDTKAVVQVDAEVADGKTAKWSAEANVAQPDLTCILRVERAKA